MKIFTFLLVFFISINAFSQVQKSKLNFINLTVGRVSFGTGDLLGYSANIEYTRRLESKKSLLQHFSLGVEISSENGSKQPKVINPSYSEFISKTFYSTTNILLTSKVGYYPFNKSFARGLNMTFGFSAGYTSQSREFQSTYIFDSIRQTSIRRSYLEYINQVVVGYRITAGYDYLIKKHFLLGGRVDFISYSNGDINTLIAGKIGYSF